MEMMMIHIEDDDDDDDEDDDDDDDEDDDDDDEDDDDQQYPNINLTSNAFTYASQTYSFPNTQYLILIINVSTS